MQQSDLSHNIFEFTFLSEAYKDGSTVIWKSEKERNSIMFSSKLLLVVLALLCVANTEGKRRQRRMLGNSKGKGMGMGMSMGKSTKKKKKFEYRVKGTAVGPDETGRCYEGDLLKRDGETVVGAFKDCVIGFSEELEPGVSLITVETSFFPDDEIDITTTCDITITRDLDLLSQGFSATETCENKDRDGAIISPDDLKGTVKMDGLVFNFDFPLLTFDLNWTVEYKE